MKNINNELIELLQPLKLPIKNLISTDNNVPTYLTFSIISINDDTYSDDENETIVTTIQLNLFTKKNYTELKRQIRDLLKSKYWDINITELYETQSKIFHIVFTFRDYDIK